MRAEVSADDVSLTCNESQPFVGYLGHALSLCSNCAGQDLLPGETAELQVCLRNYGARTTLARAELSTPDPYVVVQHDTADYGALATGAVGCNKNEHFLIQVAPDTPEGRPVEFTVTVAHDSAATVSHFVQCVGRRHFLVWDPTEDASSGDDLYLALRGHRYSGRYTATLTTEDLDGYQTLWVSLGIFPHNHLIQSGSMEAQAITAFLEAGGGVYLEGGDVWHADPAIGGHDFRPLFGIQSYSNGAGDLYQIAGEQGTYAQGILMSYHGENSSIDRLAATGPGFRLWRNNAPNYGCAIAANHGAHRTVGASIEFAGMRDAAYPNTKAEMALRLVRFFLPPDPQGVDPRQEPFPSTGAPRLELAPNPWARGTALVCRTDPGRPIDLGLYDAGGRRLGSLPARPIPGNAGMLRVETGSLAPGCYFVAPSETGGRGAVKLVVVR